MKPLILSLVLSTVFLFTPKAQIGTDEISQDLQYVYAQLTNNAMYGSAMWVYGECRSDNSEVGGEGPSDMPNWQNTMMYDYPSEDYNSAQFFRRAYNMIWFCNRVINDAPESSLEEPVKTRLIAEAKFLRALSYFNLAIVYDSVPIKTETFNWPVDPADMDYVAENVISGPFNSMSEVFDQVKTDLSEAAAGLPNRSQLTEEDMYRATKGAAQALLARVYLF